MPRKLKEASSSMDSAMTEVAYTRMGATVLGSISENRICLAGIPATMLLFDEISLPQAQHIAPHQPGNAGPVHKSENQDNAPEPRFKDGCRHQHQKYIRKGHDHVCKTHDGYVQPASKVSAQQSQASRRWPWIWLSPARPPEGRCAWRIKGG